MTKKYVHNIIRKLKCSKLRKKEIQKQIESDLQSRLEGGEKEEAVIREMGTPDEIAAAFNQSFPDSEVKSYRKEKIRKWLAGAAMVLILLIGGGYFILPGSIPIERSDTFQAAEIQEKAEKIIQLLNAEDYDELKKCSGKKLGSVLNQSLMDQAKEKVGSDWGSFLAYGNCYMAEVHQMGKKIAVVQMNVSYEHISVTYTLSFDTDQMLIGLYMK